MENKLLSLEQLANIAGGLSTSGNLTQMPQQSNLITGGGFFVGESDSPLGETDVFTNLEGVTGEISNQLEDILIPAGWTQTGIDSAFIQPENDNETTILTQGTTTVTVNADSSTEVDFNDADGITGAGDVALILNSDGSVDINNHLTGVSKEISAQDSPVVGNTINDGLDTLTVISTGDDGQTHIDLVTAQGDDSLTLPPGSFPVNSVSVQDTDEQDTESQLSISDEVAQVEAILADQKF